MDPKLTIRDPGDELPDDDEMLYRSSDAPLPVSQPERRHAAVLVPLLFEAGEWRLLFIRRATNDRDRHSGQVAFPGGAREPLDRNDVHTALREAHEEIGLTPGRVRVLGTLGAYVTISRYRVVPVVAVIDGTHSLVLQASEVARAFTIPLPWLRERRHLRLHHRDDTDPPAARRHPVIVYER